MSTSPSLFLGWIGLGSMGLAMATNIQRHLKEQDSPPLIYWNRTLSRGDTVKELGGIPSQSIGGVVESCDIVFISVSDDEALKSVVHEILKSGTIQSKIFVDTTTVHPSTSTPTTKLLSALGASYIAAPIFGATPFAQTGQLLIAIAGPAAAISLISPFLQGVIARQVLQVGEKPEQALLLKTTSNFITAGLMLLLSEAHTLAEKSGLPATVLEQLVESNFGAYAHGVSKRLTSGAYFPAPDTSPSSGLELGLRMWDTVLV